MHVLIRKHYAFMRVTIFATLAGIAVIALFFNDSHRSQAQKIENKLKTQDVMIGNVAGRVFQDFNGNGVFNTSGGTLAAPEAVDIGISGVTVSAYSQSGVLAGSATTANDGTYSLVASGTESYRVEFTNIPTGFFPSARSTDSANGGSTTNAGSTVQFVPDGNTANVNLALNKAEDYCENSPLVASQQYSYADSDLPDGIFSIPYRGSIDGTPNPTSLASSAQVGTTFGIAYHRPSRRIFSAAFFKKHAAFGPGGTAAIYQVNRNTNAVSVFVNLDNVFGVETAGANPHNTADYNTDNGNVTWDSPGKIGFGGMAMSADQSKLYAMNLANRRLYRIPTTGPLTSATIRSLSFPNTMPNCTNSSDVRPFAVTWHEGLIYVGAVCSHETDAGAVSPDLRGYVYTVDPATFTFSAAPVFSFPLTYSRGIASGDNSVPAEWNNWRTTYTYNTTANNGHWIYPQPMLTDIDFDRGNMIISLRDRMGEQAGANLSSNPYNSAERRVGITAGEVLRACGSSSAGWVLESNGRCNGIGNAPQNTGQGPDEGEYYYQDDDTTYHHQELGLGAALQIPGFNTLMTSMYNPLRDSGLYHAGGFRWFNNSTGALDHGYQAYRMESFGKSNGIGNLIALCEAAPIEIGNRIWLDTDGDGAQDPDEPGIAGVTVHLYQNGILVGTAITDVNGEYYFVSSTTTDPNTGDTIGQVNGGIQFNTTYQIRLDAPANYNPGGPLADVFLTSTNRTGQLGNDDGSDSDATNVNGSAGSPPGTFPVITYTTGGTGSNDHTLDIGFRTTAVPTAATVSVGGRVAMASGSGLARIPVVISGGRLSAPIRTVSNVFGYYKFSGIEVGQTYTVKVETKKYNFDEPVKTFSLTDARFDLDFVRQTESTQQSTMTTSRTTKQGIVPVTKK